MSILIHKDGQQLGPYDVDTVRQGLVDGTFNPDDFAFQDGCEDWVPLSSLVPQKLPPPVPVNETTALEVVRQAAPLVSVSAAFTCEDQDEAVVRKIIAKAKDLLTREETIEFIAVQKKLVVTISPEAILLTNRRFMVVRPKLMGMTFEDYLWREVQDVHMSEQLITATVSCQLIGGEMVVVDCIPKAQARKIYAFAQEAEEKMHEIRRRRQMQENRAAAGGVVVQTQANIPTPIAENRREDPVQTLGKLKELLDAGLISASEYEAKKAEVLSRM